MTQQQIICIFLYQFMQFPQFIFQKTYVFYAKRQHSCDGVWVGMGLCYYRNIIGVMSSPKRSGNQLQGIKQPQKVKVLILSESKASLKDFYLISNFTRLIKIDFSYNKLTAFPPGFSFKSFPQIRTLFLHYNKFTSIKLLLPVTESQSLHYLTLFGNPLEQTKARHFFINQMPSLMLMDDKPVRLDERNPDFSLEERTVPLLTFPLIPTPTVNAQDPHSKIYIQTLIQQLMIARKAYLSANPVVKIQRWWRHWRRMSQRKWTNTHTKPPQEQLIPAQASLKEYKHTLEEMAGDQEGKIEQTPPQQKIRCLLWANCHFWKCVRAVVEQGRVFLSREFCLLRGIHFQQIPSTLVIRHASNITGTPLSRSRRLPFLLQWHHQLVIKKHTSNTTRKLIPKEISLKMYDQYKINKNRFIHNQEKLIRREERYNHFVLPQLQKQELFSIIKKQYWRVMRAMLNNAFIQLPFILEGLANRVRAAISIQRLWRGYRVRKSVNAFLKIKEKESAIKIQRWVRRLPFIHRRKFLLEVAHYLKGQRNTEITLEMSQLQAIEAYSTYKEKQSINFAILFQQSTFSVAKNAIGSSRILFHAERKPYPSYMGLSFQVSPGEKKKKGGRSSILEILFKEVRDVNKVTDSKGVRFVRFGYDSIEEALNRKFILALKTYRMINHQFIRSREAPNVPNQYIVDLLAELNQNRLVSMVFDPHDKHEASTSIESLSLSKKLEASRSQGSFASQLAMIDGTLSLKIKYFIVKNDRSCTLFIKEPNYQQQEKHPMNFHLKQFYLARKSSKRYDQDTAEMASKISRNIISLDEVEPAQSNRRPSGAYMKILNTDQSHSILDGQPSQHHRSLNRLQSYRKSDSYDRFDKEVYPAIATEVRESLRWQAEVNVLRQKREKIEEIKAAHKKNIASISLQKTEIMTNLRRSIQRESEDRVKLIDDARSLLEQEKTRKHDRVRQHFKVSSSNFQKEFLKKGIGSIKRGFREYEKHRSFRDPLPVSPPAVTSLKTQIKEFSINFDPDQSQKEVLKKSVQEYHSREPTHKSNTTEVMIKVEQAPIQVDPQSEQKKAMELQRKKLRKKRLVHSVFPEQFYPIKQANQIGFQLPKIFKK